jgi:hypothetical protein
VLADLLGLLAAQAHANGLVALSGAVGLGLMGAVLLVPVVAIEAFAYRRLLEVTWLRGWLSALLANVAAAIPMAIAVFCVSLVRWSWPYHAEEERAEALTAAVCLVGLIAAKTAIIWAMHRKHPARRPIWCVALGTSALTTALVVGACMALYDLG